MFDNPTLSEYDTLKQHIGKKADIVSGSLVVSDSGFLTILSHPANYSVYLDSTNKTVQPIVPREQPRGQVYKLRTRDCVVTVAQWLDNRYGTKLLDVYKSASNTKFYRYYTGDFGDWFKDNGFVLVTDDSQNTGDVLFYGNYNHIGIRLEDNKILHHLPHKYSSIDVIDDSLIRKVYRYGNS
jgi:hypothetical protein